MPVDSNFDSNFALRCSAWNEGGKVDEKVLALVEQSNVDRMRDQAEELYLFSVEREQCAMDQAPVMGKNAPRGEQCG
jgi:hypothetical protein